MTKTFAVLPVLALGIASLANAQTGTKVGIIHVQNAILSTKDGQKAAAELQTRFAPKKADLDKKQAAIAALQAQFRSGSATMSDDAKLKLTRDIDANTKSLNRETQDAQDELDQEQGKVMQELGQKLMAVLDKYAKDNGFGVILDVSSQQTPVLWASNATDITGEIVKLYDAAAGTPAAPAAAKPANAVPRTPAAPAGKK